MNNISGFIVSSARTCEKSASSEVYYLLTEILGYENVEVKPTKNVSGLSIATFYRDPVNTLEKVKEEIEKDPSLFRFTLKLVPFQYMVDSNLEEIRKIAKEMSTEIKEKEKWKIVLRRRHTQLGREEVITAVAAEITGGSVDLQNPDMNIIIEIVGRWTYLCLSPLAELSLANYVKEPMEDDFTF
ncbi:MAG: THUMP domain-containing protein [Candidatus Heimdallarchaeaceae archaeon]